MIVPGRGALDQVWLTVGDDAGQDGNAQPGADRREKSHRRGVLHDHPVVEAKLVQPSTVGTPQFWPATTDENVFPKFRTRPRDAMLLGIPSTAIERPIV